jgi:diacylglycerol kinase family enzyme
MRNGAVQSKQAGPALARATRHFLLVVNAHASGVEPALVAGISAELARWGGTSQTLLTESAEELAAALDGESERRVVLVGGDGTLHAAANIRDTRPELAVIPVGRANNVARSLGIPLGTPAAARLAVEGRPKPIDAIEAATPQCRYVSVEGLSVGFLSQARARYHEENSAHLASGLAAGVQALSQFHPFSVRVVRGARADELALGQMFVANLPLYGFGLHVAPDADPTDKLLDVIAIDCHGRRDVPPMIVRLLRATELARPEAHHWRAERVRIDTHGALPVIADSFELGPGPVEVSVLPRELPLVRP